MAATAAMCATGSLLLTSALLQDARVSVRQSTVYNNVL
jgi:hypothetical protein